ncbi:MAG: HAD family phosphatase [Treponema sp.]|jgi:putative hydrolase of the HAD superfamily|nr:HAD family phosphatase [Treponema sp.]
MIEAVIFDYGGVISTSPPFSVREDLAALAGIPVEKLNKVDRVCRREYDRGRFDTAGYYRHLAKEAGIRAGEETILKMARIDTDSWKNFNPGTLELMEDVKAKGFTLGILSNMPFDFLDWLKTELPVFHKVDLALFSCELALIKPEKEIYEILAERLGCGFENIVFFDDMRENIDAAKALGIRGFVWKNAEEARSELQKLEPERFRGRQG